MGERGDMTDAEKSATAVAEESEEEVESLAAGNGSGRVQR